MNHLKILLLSALTAVVLVALPSSSETAQACETDLPDPQCVSLHGHKGQGNGNGGHNSPTGIPGDNPDDPNSGRVDCLGDGDSGQGNDERFCPPPGDDDGDDDDGDGDGDPPPEP